MNLINRLACVLVAFRQSRSVSFAMATWSRTSPVENSTPATTPTTSSVDTFTTDEASDLVDALNAHYVLLTHHQGFEDHNYDTGFERPSLTNPTWSAVLLSYRPINAGSAILDDVSDMLDFIDAPSADDYHDAYVSAYQDNVLVGGR